MERPRFLTLSGFALYAVWSALMTMTTDVVAQTQTSPTEASVQSAQKDSRPLGMWVTAQAKPIAQARACRRNPPSGVTPPCQKPDSEIPAVILEFRPNNKGLLKITLVLELEFESAKFYPAEDLVMSGDRFTFKTWAKKNGVTVMTEWRGEIGAETLTVIRTREVVGTTGVPTLLPQLVFRHADETTEALIGEVKTPLESGKSMQ